MNTRRATHAGSWYQSDGKALGKELEEWMKSASAKVSITKLMVYSYVHSPDPLFNHIYTYTEQIYTF